MPKKRTISNLSADKSKWMMTLAVIFCQLSAVYGRRISMCQIDG